MIRWDLTQQKFKLTPDKASKFKKVVVECERCHNVADLLMVSHRHAVALKGAYYCHNCVVSSKEFRAQCAGAAKKLWQDPRYISHNLAAVQSDEFKQKKRLETAQRWRDQAHRNRMLAIYQTDAYRNKCSKAAKGRWANALYRSKMMKALQSDKSKAVKRNWWCTNRAAMRAMIKDRSRNLWKDPEFVKKIKASHNTPEFLARMRSISHGLWQAANYRSNVISAMAQARARDPHFVERMRQRGLLAWDDAHKGKTLAAIRAATAQPEYKARMAAITAALWQDADYRSAVISGLNQAWPESKRLLVSTHVQQFWQDAVLSAHAAQAISAKSKARWADPEWRANMIERIKAYTSTQAFRDKMALIAQARWQNAAFRLKMADTLAQMPSVSTQARMLYSLLDDMQIRYEREGPSTTVGYYVFDCLIHHAPRSLLIEVNGDYWHDLPKSIRRDKSKLAYIHKYFRDQYEVHTLWEHEFKTLDKVRSRILYWLGRSVPDAQVIDLNKIEIKQIEEYGVVNEFLSKYHYLNGRAGVAFGAFYDDTLIAVCVFSKCVRKQMADRVADFSTVLELSRFCIRPEYQVHNLGSWMLSRCVKRIKALKPEIMALISFADTTYDHTGALYKACNWQLDGEVEPDYWYRDAEGFVMHKLTLYRHAVQLSLTESAYCEKYGYQKVYGDKKYRFLWRF